MEQVVIGSGVVHKRRWQCQHCFVYQTFPMAFNGMVRCDYCKGLFDISPPFIHSKLPEFKEVECRFCGQGEMFSILKRFVGSFKTPCCHQILYAHPDHYVLFLEEEWVAQRRSAVVPTEGVIIALIPE